MCAEPDSAVSSGTELNRRPRSGLGLSPSYTHLNIARITLMSHQHRWEDRNGAGGRDSPRLTHLFGRPEGWRWWWRSPEGLDPRQQDAAQHRAASPAGIFSLQLTDVERNRSKRGTTRTVQREKRRRHAYSLIARWAPPCPPAQGGSALPRGLGADRCGRGAAPPPSPPSQLHRAALTAVRAV